MSLILHLTYKAANKSKKIASRKILHNVLDYEYMGNVIFSYYDHSYFWRSGNEQTCSDHGVSPRVKQHYAIYRYSYN